MLKSKVNKEPPWWAWMIAIMIIMLSVAVTFGSVPHQEVFSDIGR